MAFNQQEQEIIQWGLSNGKSKQEVQTAIENFRLQEAGIQPKPEPTRQSFAQDLIGDITQTGREIGQSISSRGEDYAQEEGLFGKTRALTGALADTSGALFKGGVKAVLTQ